ncbi:hypothetical protein CSV79_08795 [Sporosarcina sp. P13]|uniref:hypothetical protein n=1 Tax=Sporosarcina sp. P13 TaxID=2048263 RepID=UPI000C1666C2|nr:hypothetical protein [Sporosarcina sp. P13]PIC64007.1 hypothetical protein CSV79_08795 [Sporosarcina sp. P13]
MKKGLKLSIASAMAVSALAPVAAFAAEDNAAKDGFYTKDAYISPADYAALSQADKTALLTNEDTVIVQAGLVYYAKDSVGKTSADLEKIAITQEKFEAENGELNKDGYAIEVSVSSAKAINAKTIEVTFNKAVEDTSKAKVELLRGTFKQNATVKWAADKKSVQLVGASNFQPADYTVNISGLTEAALSNTVKVEAQKVSAIEILDEVAVVDKDVANGVFPAGTKATVGYVVKDQYGTDITKTRTLTTNDTKIVPNNSKGIVEISGSAVEGKKINDLVPVVLIDTETGISVTKTLKLSATSTVSSIEVAGVYNAKGEALTLNDQSKAADAYIVLDLKDQYGKEITDATKAAGLVVTNTNETNLTVAKAVSSVKIDGKDRLVIDITAIKKAGDTDILLISTTNGQSVKYTVKVAETAATDVITVSQPEIAVANEDILIPITVTDKQGNVITDKKLLADASKGIKVGGTTVAESALEVKNGQVYYKTQLAAGNQALVFQSSNFKVATLTLNVKAEAKATIVRGLKNPLVISTQKPVVTITAKDHLVIEDQYGRVIENSTAPVLVTLEGTTNVLTVAGNVVTASKKGTATLKIKLATENGTIDSAVEVPVRVTDGTEYTGYEVATIGKVEAGQAKNFTVNGLLNNGKVALEASEYTATISGGKLTTPVAATSPVTIAAASLNTANNAAIDTEFTLKVTINATGEVLEQKFIVSPEAKVVQDFFFTTSAVKANHDGVKGITEATLQSGATVASNSLTAGTPAAVVNFATTDQYGNKAVVAKETTTATFTIVPEKVGEVKIEGNGTLNAKATLVDPTKEAKVTIKVKVGNATKELKATVTPQQN